MKYITKFDTESNYLTFRGSKDYVLPNVSYCEQEKSVKCNYIAPPPPQHNGIEYVDLGLPSGTKWAKCNVGADSETDYGLYFAWGETEGYSGYTNQKRFGWYDYYFVENWSSNDKYFYKYGSDDNKTVLDLEDDAANVNMGGNWHMPSKEQINELIANTNSTWENNYNGSGINGRLFTSKSDDSKRLFIPASGNLDDGWDTNAGNKFEIWGNSIGSYGFEYGIILNSNESDLVVLQDYRYCGKCVRGVLN